MNFQEQLVALTTIVRKEIRRFLRIWVQTLIPPAITIVLYFVIFGQLIGNRIGQMGGYNYMQFIVPGLIMMSVITNSYGNVVSSFFGNKFQHCIEELMVSPTPEYIIILGFVIGGVVRGILVGGIVSLLSLFFADLTLFHAGITISIVILTAVLFSLGGLINAIYANKFDDISIIPTFILTPLTYLGGVFYSIDLLPPFWAAVSKANPIVYMVNGFRYGILGVSDVSLGVSYAMIALFITGLYLWAFILMRRGVGMRS
ncbi:ABC transporter permease [bacterium]|nr:ABC transporter permease [bacterium]